MKPKLLNDVLRQNSPRKFIGNRYAVLCDVSPADSLRSNASFRPRSQSVKRKNDSDFCAQPSYASITTGINHTQHQIQLPVEDINVNIAKVKSICDKVTKEIGSSSLDPAAVTILSMLNEAITGICDNQHMIVEAHKAKQTSQQVVDTVCLDTEVSDNSQKRAKHDQNRSTMVDLGSISGTGIFSQRVSRVPAPHIEVNPEVKKFKDSITIQIHFTTQPVHDIQAGRLLHGLHIWASPLGGGKGSHVQPGCCLRWCSFFCGDGAELDL
jgi:hypothetical protein